jgi:hypothetical protein
MTQRPPGDAPRRAPSCACLEISGDFDRATAEALMLEIQRVAKRSGVGLTSRVERAIDQNEAGSV